MTSRARKAVPIFAAFAVLATACNLDLTNPNAPTEEEVVSDLNGLLAVAVGMQGQFAQAIDDYMVTNSLVTDEWGTETKALISYQSLLTGENFDPSYLVVSAPWSASYSVIKSANTVLAGADNVGLGAGLRAGTVALAKLFKAMAFGMLIQQYDQVPIDVTTEGSLPQPRAVVMDTILDLLESARADIANVSDADLAGFKSRVAGTGFDLRNTIDAMLARYYLMAGRYADAFAAADRVSLTTLSVLSYPAPTRNPIENLAFQLGYVAGLKSFADQAEAGDRRPSYWLNTAIPGPAGNPDSVLLFLKKYSTPQESFPLYLPDEMKLIKAEALVRSNSPTTEALALVNEVRTQTSSPVDEPVAGLPPVVLATQAELLAEIAKQRRYELYEQGLRWEDTRRFGTALTTTPTQPFLPIPQQECNTNPANPCG
ncbi:MAG TPA: RagB/SusD family nutrient uptake outer membrane protein [Gemmatimonadaceae bacterium]|nr:RagB/SusD family nutrient uptake outer membrane protein [Gemmatimonadaceae bacterium]